MTVASLGALCIASDRHANSGVSIIQLSDYLEFAVYNYC